jgi:integrase/recombinase XerD
MPSTSASNSPNRFAVAVPTQAPKALYVTAALSGLFVDPGALDRLLCLLMANPPPDATRSPSRPLLTTSSRDDPGGALVLWTEPDAAAARGVASRAAPSPALVAFSGARASRRTIEFLTAHIRNAHARRAYHRAARRFLAWCTARGLTLDQVESPDVAAYVEELARSLAAPLGQATPGRPQALDGLARDRPRARDQSRPGCPRPALQPDRRQDPRARARRSQGALLDSIDASTVVAARDKALLAVMLFSFARVGAVVAMRVRDYRGAGTPRASFLLHEKNGKDHAVPAHHLAAEYLDAYLALSRLAEQSDAPLWQSAPRRSGVLSGLALSARAALYLVKPRCEAAGLPGDICNHSFRATGITLHQDAGGDLEAARQIAGHANIKTTQLYNRSGDRKRKAEVERVQL